MGVAIGLELITRTSVERTDEWLCEKLRAIWRDHFADVPALNPIEISYARPWKCRLGLITLTEKSKTSLIRLNRLLAHPGVPECVNTITIAHELVHYAHGFGSTLPRRYEHPHQGGIVKKELVSRGFAEEHDRYVQWIDDHWFPFYHSLMGTRRGARC
ncbi:MAG: hypothetical protein HY329_20470 [Chloroflexi bacterium]|nr:hypothetical protein [Chloroflexota bacterium]